MKVVGLISGGKDSCYNMMQCISEGHQIIALANLKPKNKDELDSYMYQSVGHHAIDLYAEAMGLPLYQREILGSSRSTGRDYQPTPEDEVEDLFELLKTVKDEMGIEAVSVGAILSNYQRVRVEHVCQRLGLVPLAYLWRRDQSELLDEMINCHLQAILIKVAALGLYPKKHLGKTLAEMRDYLHEKKDEFDLNVCGEGGEYETFTLDCPIFRKRIVIDEKELVMHSKDPFAPVGYLNLRKAHLEDKFLDSGLSQADLVRGLPLRHSRSLLQQLFPDGEGIQCIHCGKLQDPRCSAKISANRKPVLQKRTDCCGGKHFWVTDLVAVAADDKDISAATLETMNKLQELIQPHTCSDLVLLHLYVRNMEHFAAINTVYKTYFSLNPASRVCVQTDLPENVLLMLDCYGNSCSGHREAMHVQGLSHWAPANIGPYSQCVKIDSCLYLAGQIGMVPANLSLVEGGIHPQARLSLRHVTSILHAMSPCSSPEDIVTCICYVTQQEYITIAKEELNTLVKEPVCVPVYVVVPQLPKEALIEWQVVARANIQRPCKMVRHNSLTDSVYSCRATGILDSASQWLSVVVSVYTSQDVDMTALDVTLVTELLHLYREKVLNEGKQLSQDFLSSLRIFYRACLFKYDDLRNNLLKAFEDVPVVLVPVSQLETAHTLVTLCETCSDTVQVG